MLTTRAADGAPHGITVNSFSSLSLTPPLVIVAIDRSCTFLAPFESSRFFAVNILRENQVDLSVRFAEWPEGRFTGIAWTDGVTSSPVLDGILGVIECKTTDVLDAGDHRALIGEVVGVEIGEGRPLIFFNGGYSALTQ